MLIEGGEHCANHTQHNSYRCNRCNCYVEYGEHCGNDYAVLYTDVTVMFIEALIFIYT